jgi:hypothetical protein
MMINGPELRFSRPEDPTARALRLAREIEELLEHTVSVPGRAQDGQTGSLRMARAVAASLVDELEQVTRGGRQSDGNIRRA